MATDAEKIPTESENIPTETAKNGTKETETAEIESAGEKLGIKRASDDVLADAAVPKKLKVEDGETEPTELEKKIIRQMEYYFSDINLSRDKFMQGKIAENNGWISMKILLTFKRLASLSTDPEVIVKALAKSETQLVQVSEDNTQVRRAPEIPLPEFNEERRKELITRTAYVKGFPLNAELDDLLKWFEDKKGVESVHKRSYLDKATKKFNFKGSVFVIFKTVDDCKSFIEGGPYNYDTEKSELIVKWQEQYLNDKKKERQEAKDKKEKTKDKPTNKVEKEIGDSSIVELTGLSEETVRDDIKSTILSKYEIEVKFVEYTKGNPSGHIRLQGKETGGQLLEKCGGKVEINNKEVEIRVLDGEELKKYLDKVKKEVLVTRHKFSRKRNRNRRN